MTTRILHGDCRVILPTLDPESFDACVTDPPYELGFMGKDWDRSGIAFQPETWQIVYDALKPGAHLVAFGGTRTSHRMACAIEDAGFEIRDKVLNMASGDARVQAFAETLTPEQIVAFSEIAEGFGRRQLLAWVYGTGFPKSHDAERAVSMATCLLPGRHFGSRLPEEKDRCPDDHICPTTPAGAPWQGWGTALKPAWESIVVAQKPYDLRGLSGVLAQRIAELVCQLPSRVKDVGKDSPLSRSVFVEGFGSAQWNAVAACNSLADLLDLTDTWPSGLVIPTSLSIALSWLDTLAAVSRLGSTFTTETISGLTIDLITLNSLLSKITPDCIIEVSTPGLGISQHASLAARIFHGVACRLQVIHELSVLDPAISRDVTCSQGVGVEPIILARKPLVGTVAENVLAHGTGALNIDACRVPTDESTRRKNRGGTGNAENWRTGNGGDFVSGSDAGRWPANVVHDGSAEVEAAFAAFGERASGNGKGGVRKDKPGMFGLGGDGQPNIAYGDSGPASRFFYSPKADKQDRLGSKHPTVKPVALIRWLCKLITPPGGHILDPFGGSGTTAMAALADGFDATLIELSSEHIADIRARVAHVHGHDTPLFAESLP